MRIASRQPVTPLEAGLLVVLCTLPFHYCVQRQLRKLSDRGYLREHGVVITQLRALEGHAQAVGTYMGRERIGPCELYI